MNGGLQATELVKRKFRYFNKQHIEMNVQTDEQSFLS